MEKSTASMPVKMLVLSAMFTALTAILSQISIPLPFTPVPISMATFAVFCTGALLGPKYGSLSMALYTLLGAFGVPVFAQFTAGLGILIGPSGGYIIGYIFAALIIGLIVNGAKRKIWAYPLAMSAGIAACYAFGTVWFCIVYQIGIVGALMSCVVPFLIGDALKIAVATLLCPALYKALTRQRVRI